MGETRDEINQRQFEWTRRRLEALDKIEAKLLEMRELAVYAASRTLGQKEVAQVQEWLDILKAEVNALDQATASGGPVYTNLLLWPNEPKKPLQ